MPANPEAAKRFHALHAGPDVLLLPNAWDAASARFVEEAGAKAIATSSAAVAWSHGYRDGHHLPVAKLVATLEEIARVVAAPITCDSEAGYADEPAEVGENIFAICNAGAVGINLEDGRDPPDLHCRKIEAARAAASRAGVDLYINARIDVFLKKLTPPEAMVEETIKRARAAKNAGASGLFVPAASNLDQIAAIVEAVAMPVNIMVWPGVKAADLKRVGVRRLSAGGGIASAAWAATRAATEEFLAGGDSDALLKRAGPPVNINELFKR